MNKIRATPNRLSRTHTFNSLFDLLNELALQRKSDATLKNLHPMAQLKWLDGNANTNTNAINDQEEGFARLLCEECFVAFQQARRQGQGNGDRGGGGRGRGDGRHGKGQGQGQWYWRRQVEEDNSQTPKFFATVYCPSWETKHNVRDKAWQVSLDARREDQRRTKQGQGKEERTKRNQALKEKKKEVEEKRTEERQTKEKEAKKKPPEKKRLGELLEGEREKKRKKVLKLERQAKSLKDFLAGEIQGEA